MKYRGRKICLWRKWYPISIIFFFNISILAIKEFLSMEMIWPIPWNLLYRSLTVQWINLNMLTSCHFFCSHCYTVTIVQPGLVEYCYQWNTITDEHKHRTVQIYLYNIVREKAMLESILNSCFSPTMPCDDIICFTYSCQIRLSIARLIIWNTSRIC